ncbi:PP2C family protein-serine/threonine phosphatase [Haliovirga abyssi]|uniref:Protein-serine/threonine phosphatase n=1 Tax=Haliovirga abyssi TaxID=2996794 RepID=A0AAU9DGP6_9FUSO|nr:protein phosphatase 2C domain-containing protein [Haliovirga abyssi]BDU50617.1 protein-serine/threonine phosphatase [Haliovirga abyssi]
MFKINQLIYFLFTLIISISILIIYFRNRKSKLKILVGSSQILGERNEQEDNYSVINSDNGLLAVLADGMGGFLNGKLASKIAVETFLEEFVKVYNLQNIGQFFINTSYIANDKLLKVSMDSKMGTTLVSCYMYNNKLYWVSIGDSHIYLYRNKEINLLNNVHTYSKVLLSRYKAGEISRSEYFSNSKRERLTSYLGYKNFHEIDYNENGIELLKGDKVILCSDGVYKSLTEEEILNYVSKKINPEIVTEEIMLEIEDKRISGQDNATIIMVEKR